MAQSTPLFRGTDAPTTFHKVVVGIGAVWVFLGIALFYRAGFTVPEAMGTALALALIPNVITIGGHEAAHHFVADEYCRYPEVEFGAYLSTTALTLLSAIGALILTGLDVFGVVSVPRHVLLLAMVSPGAVVAQGKADVSRCMDETAIAGPLWNFIVGFGFWWGFYNFTYPIPIIVEVTWPSIIALTTVLSLGLAFLNALPVGPLDGNKVWRAQEPITLTLWAVVLVGSGWFLLQPIT